MDHLLVICTVIFAALLGWLLISIAKPYLSRNFLDRPNSRSSHITPTPRGGGLAFVLVASISSVVAFVVQSSSLETSFPLLAAPLIAMPLAIIGFIDDHQSLPATWRYAAQLTTALALVLISPLISFSFGLLPLILLLMIAVTAVINFTNFMDGLDGLVAGCMAFVITTAAIQLSAPWPIWALVGALLGFLVWNWSPAKVFMGDVGSTFLGVVFAFMVLQSSSWYQATALLLVSTPLLGDAFICVLRRFMAGQQVFEAHRLHLFQRLHQSGWPHSYVSCLYIAATAVLAIAFLWGGLLWLITLAAFEILFGIWLDRHVAVPFAVVSRL